MIPSIYQADIFDAVENTNDSLLIEAVAGSGKTTTIVAAVKLLPKRIRAIFVAFNKAIAEELGTRLPDHIESSTLHSVGLKAWRSVAGNIKIDAKKVYTIMDQDFICKDLMTSEFTGMVRFKIKTLVGLMKNHGMVPPGSRDYVGLAPCEDEDIRALMSHYDVDFNLSKEGLTRHEYVQMVKEFDAKLFRICRRILEVNIKNRNTLDFDDMLYFPVIAANQIKFPKYHVVMVDEAQDVSQIQRVILKNILRKDGRLIAVGDSCQPGNTLVKVVENKQGKFHGGTLTDKPISELSVGDLVVSYDITQGQYIKGRRVNGITRKPYIGRLIKVTTESGLYSEYTSNHHCIADFSSIRDKYVVYLMTRHNDTQARIGVCRMDYGSVGSGLVCRFRAEKADKAWILGLFDYRNDALLHEQIFSFQYSIPTMIWVDSNSSKSFPQTHIDSFWDNVGDMNGLIQVCLDLCEKSILYPLLEKSINGASKNLTLKRPIVVRAINLESGCSVLPYKENRTSYKKDYEKIQVEVDFFDGDVYSLDVDQDHTYIADGIVTHNCQAIYGFRGADSKSLQSIAEDFGTRELPLSICYRCPKSVVEVAKQYVPTIEPHDNAPEGEVVTLGDYNRNTMDGFERGDYIVCRNVAPLVKCAFSLITNRKPCAIKGKDIGATIKSLIKSLKPTCIPELRQRLRDWEANEKRKLLEDDPQANLSRIEDRADSVRTFIDCSGASTVDAVCKAVDDMFSDKVEGAIMLSTIHKAKGLEADRVLFLDSQLIPSKYATQEWQKQQETNLLYVAVTRAKSYLGYITTPDDKVKVEL